MRYIYTAVTVSFVIMLCFGCSKGTGTVLPEENLEKLTTIESLPVGVSEYFPDGTPAGGMGMLGLFQLHINPLKKSASSNFLTDDNSYRSYIDYWNGKCS